METKIKLNKSIINELKTIRKRSDVLAKDVADYIHKSPAYITKLENGEIKTIGVDTLKRYFEINHQPDDAVEDLLEKYFPIYKVKANKTLSEKIDIIIEAIGTILDGDSENTLKRIDTLVKNFQMDKCFTFAFMTRNLSGLKHLNYADKKNFLKEVSEIIEKYNNMMPTIDFFTDIYDGGNFNG